MAAMMRPMVQLPALFQNRLANTALMSILASGLIVASAATLGRAVHNIQGALTTKPDIALYLLLPDEGVTDVTLLRDMGDERHYLAETRTGPKLVKLEMRNEEWTVSTVEPLRAGGGQ